MARSKHQKRVQKEDSEPQYFNALGRPDAIPKWWTVDQDEKKDDDGKALANAIRASLALMRVYQERRTSQAVFNARLYGNLAISSPFGIIISELQTATAVAPTNRLTFNVIRSCVDTIVSRIAARVKPRPYWLSTEGTYKDKRRAKRLNKFSDGLMSEQKIHKLATKIFRDSTVFGTGVLGVFFERGRIKMERVIPSEIWVDEKEALHGAPRQLHRVKLIDRGTLAELYPKKRELILHQDLANVDNVPSNSSSTHELVEVCESWRLPDGPDAPGLHVISAKECVLFREEWTHEWFPFVFLPYSEPMVGFWGHGLVEELSDIQLHINKFLFVISRAVHLAGAAKCLVEISSGVKDNHITNSPSTILHYRGTKPEWIAPPIVPVELYQQVETQIQRAYQLAGVSQLSAAGQKPAGLNAAVAIREYLDIEQDRFAQISEQYQYMYVEALRIAIELIADGVKSGEVTKYTVKQYGGHRAQVVDWSDLDFDRDRFVLDCWPVSALPTEPAGRLETVQEWVQAGLLTMRKGKRLLMFPDLDAEESLANAAEEWIEHCLDSIVDDGKYIPPDPEDDLNAAAEMVSEEIQSAKLGELEPKRLTLLRDYRDQVQDLQLQTQLQAAQRQQMIAAASAPPVPPGGPTPPGPGAGAEPPPVGVPAPPPVSELMPQTQPMQSAA